MKGKCQLDDRQLSAYADKHVKYELEMLCWCASILYAVAPKKEESVLPLACNNAFLEAFLVHARTLIDFLYLPQLVKEDRIQDTDIIVQDYIDSEQLSAHLPPLSSNLSRVRMKANKRVAHLTQNRTEYEEEDKGWDTIGIVREITSIFRRIAPAFPKTKTSSSFRQFISHPLIPLLSARLIREDHGPVSTITIEIQSSGMMAGL